MNPNPARALALTMALACAGCSQPRSAAFPAGEPDPHIRAATLPPSAATGASSFLAPPPAQRQAGEYPGRLFVGARLGINAGSGEPANDIPTFGAFGRYRVRGPWLLGLAVDQATFDFENPAAQLDIPVASVVDASIDATTLSIWGEYELRLSSRRLERLRPFIGAGVGVGFLSDDEVTGPIQGGGAFDIAVSGGTEIIPGAVGGVRFELLRNVTLEAGLRFDYHFTDLEVHDNLGGGTAVVDDYPTYGAYAGLLIRL